ncbi:dehydrogenase [Microbacter margulisiae]|uniref:D-glycero-alpha-D-manno-heptose-7-phosphate kinase n=1 Tax=Microbacter margulisiae TaxID=1350067 RepID=A0A7W5H3L5_9PORP|nr:dehydrogenase [Microbacter margulisiae]MBB3188749.1 D-glycero-alpha-D-manno-heptose-7-phosphate kinase [Microbacter margulisiae]
MLHRSKAPLRLGLAGGGTDVSPFSDLYGGTILNATISLYAHATIEPIRQPKVILQAWDRNERVEIGLEEAIEIDGLLPLHKGIYKRIRQDYLKTPHGFRLTTFVDAPAGSGLGTSSTLAVAIIGAFVEWLKLPLGSYEIARYAYEIERIDLGMAGGKQDQYAATFGGVNYMEFFADDKVIVNPLRIGQKYLRELEHNLLLYYTDQSRDSSQIIKEQQKNVRNQNAASLEAMHRLKQQATDMKNALLTGRLHDIGYILDDGYSHKREMAQGISTPKMDTIYEEAKKAGALGGKISGAGGGGFMMFYCPDNVQYAVAKALSQFEGRLFLYSFVEEGLYTWSM